MPGKEHTAPGQPDIPDVPLFVRLRHEFQPSPYHVGVESDEHQFIALYQIGEAAIGFVKRVNEMHIPLKLDFAKKSLSVVDMLLANEVPDDDEDVIALVREFGAYVGKVIELDAREEGGIGWDVSVPTHFSALRFLVGDGTWVETNPFAQVYKRLTKQEGAPSMVEYFEQVKNYKIESPESKRK